MAKLTISSYRGITHIPGSPLLYKLWKFFFCRKDIHLFDEVESGNEHYLSCSGCDLEVGIAYIKEH